MQLSNSLSPCYWSGGGFPPARNFYDWPQGAGEMRKRSRVRARAGLMDWLPLIADLGDMMELTDFIKLDLYTSSPEAAGNSS